MNDIGVHLGLFLLVAAAVVGVSCMFTEADDGRALRLFPRRYAKFVIVSAFIAGVMIALEETLASIS